MIDYRPISSQADRDFVVSSWSSSFRTSFAAGILDMEHWAEVMHAQVERYLDRPDVRTIIAAPRSDQSTIYGFIAADTTPQLELLEGGRTRSWPALVYYAYVKAPYRRTGIARGLFDAVGVDVRRPFLYLCKTPWASRLAGKAPDAKWQPLVARFGKVVNDNASPSVQNRRPG